jgi:hypothetical protein
MRAAGCPVALIAVHFPWGSVLALDPALFWPPLRTLRQRAVALCAIVVIILGALTGDPGHSRGQEGGGSTELFAAVSFGRSRSGAPLDRRLFSAEDANPSWTFSDLGEPSPNRVDHLMLSLSLVGTPDQPLCRPMRCPPHAPRGW